MAGIAASRHRSWRVVCALAVAIAAPISDLGAGSRADDLPNRLTIQQFWQLSTDLSEPGETFISDNLVSNRASFVSRQFSRPTP